MKNKREEAGSKSTQPTIATGVRARASDGTGPAQISAAAPHSLSHEALPRGVASVAATASPPPARAASEVTSKTERKRKWYSLMDKVYAPSNLQTAWEKVQSNGGSAGADGMTIAMFSRNAPARLEALSKDLKAKTYRPKPVRRVSIPKAGGGTRPLGIPAIHDRIVQQALLQVLNPIFDVTFSERSHGFRPGRGCHSALNVVDRAVRHYAWVVDADIQGFFDNVNHGILLAAINEEVSDGNILRLIRSILEAGVVHPGAAETDPTTLGTPQGGPLSPLLANIYLNQLDRAVAGRFNLVRYADDFVIFAKSQSEAEAALSFVREILEGDLKLTLHPEKTRIVTVDCGFSFLGFHYYRTAKGLLIKEVSRKSMQRMRDRVRELTPRIRNQTKPKQRHFTLTRLAKNQRLGVMLVFLNRYLQGWFGYFRMVSLPRSTAFVSQDKMVRRRLRQALTGRIGNGWWNQVLNNSSFHELGLVSLRGLHLTALERRALFPARKG